MRLKNLKIKNELYIMPTTSHVEQYVIKQKKKSMNFITDYLTNVYGLYFTTL